MANLLMPLQIERQYGASLDANYSFDTLEELKNYATTSALSYSGQILYCKENDTLYKVNNDKTDVGTLGGGASDIIVAHTPDEADALRKKVNRNKLMFYMGNTKSSYVHGELYYLHWNAITIKKFYTKGGGTLEIDYDVLEQRYANWSDTITFNAKYKEDPSNAMNRWFCEYSGGSGSRLDVVGVNIANGSETLGDVIEFTYNSASKNSDNYTWKPLFVKPQRTFEKNWWLVNKIATYGGGYDNEFINGHRYQFTADININATASENIVVSLDEEQYKNYFRLHSKSSFIYNANTGCFEYRYGAIGYEDNRFTIEYLNKAGITWTGEIANDDAIIVTCTMSDDINDYYWKDLDAEGGGYTQLSQAEYDALTEDEKMNGREYRTYDTGHIYKLGVEYGKDADISRSEVLKTYVSLYNLNTRKGLSLEWENNVDNTQKIIDALEGREEFMDSFSSSTNRIGIVGNYGTTINNFHIIKRSADLAIITATTNAGTILNRTYTNGTLSDWCVNIAVYTSLKQLGLTSDATIEDVVNSLKNGESFLAPVNTFTNYETIFPNKLPNDQWNKIHIIKGTSLGNSHIRCFSQSGACEYLANVNNTNIVSWNDVSGTYIDISDSVIEKLGTEILKYPVGKYRINSTTTGNKFIDLPSDAETKCGLIEVNGTAVGKSPFTDTWVYRMYKFECLTGTSSYVRRLNSGATVGQIELDTGWCKDGQETYTSLEELGLTAPTTVGEVFMAMPNKSTLMLNVEAYAEKDGTLPTVTDIPAEYGVLTIDKWSNSRFRIEFNNSLGGSSTTVKQWIGTLKGNDGTGLKWKQVNTGNHKYTTMAELALDGSTATIQDVMDKVAVGDSVMMRTDAFNNNNWKTQCNGIQWGYLKIEKTMNNLSNIELQEVITPNRRYFGTQSSGKFAGWVQMNTKEIVHTDLSGNLADITTVLDLVNALLTEYRATSPKKPIRFVSGEFTKTNLTDLPVAYGLLQITVAGWDVIEVRLAHSANGFKTMYYGFVNRISGEESISSITWKEVTTKSIYNSVAELNKAKGTSIELVNGEDNTKKIVDTLSVGEQFISFYHNNANQNRFGIDVSYGNLIHELRITKCLDADLTANYATVTAFMNTGCIMSRIYYKTYSTDWSSTKDYVESLT